MAWTFESVFETDKDILTLAEQIISEYAFSLEGISQTIRIRLYKTFDSDRIFFDQSHYIHTPTQAGAYMPSSNWGDYESYALHEAVTSITRHYKHAVKEGHIPDDLWLIVNDKF